MKYVFKKPLYKLLIPALDILGTIAFLPLKIFRKNLPSDPRNILVVRLDHIGDFVCTTPLFKNLKNKFPDAKITILMNSASKELAYRNPYIDKVITFSPVYLARNERSSTLKGLLRVVKDMRNIGFDLGMEPRGDLTSILLMWLGGVKYRIGYGITGGGFLLNKACDYNATKHVIDRNLGLLEELNIPASHRLPEVYFNEKDEEAVERLLRPVPYGTGLAMTEKKFVVLHPFAGTKSKEWSRDNFQKLIAYLKSEDREILLVGSKDDIGNFEDVIDLRGNLSLPQLACLISKIRLFIGVDSGPANIAAALNVSSVIICSGTNVPELWLPRSGNVRLVYKDTECKPCSLRVCPEEKHNCMESLELDGVIERIEELWQA